jgi:hypothetical protein
MQPQRSGSTGGPLTVLAIVGVLFVPACITLMTIRHPADSASAGQPSPFGYTWSLSLAFVPIAVILAAARARLLPRPPWRTVGATVAVLGSLGMLLDIFLGHAFFAFPNKGATLRIGFWGFDLASGRWIPGLPIEEVAFYYSTVAATLLTYVWASTAFLSRYSTDLPHAGLTHAGLTHAGRYPRSWLYWPAALPGAGLIAAALLYTQVIRPAPARFPGYFIFIIMVALVPACLLHRATRQAINWQAVAFCTLVNALVDVIWEVTLASPYGWWAYRQDMMIGPGITAWHNLPIEEPVLWLVSPFCIVTMYTALRLATGRRVHQPDSTADEPSPACPQPARRSTRT